MDIEIRQDELLEEVQNRFPNQLRICIQAIQIKKMSMLVENAPEEDAEVSPGPNLSGDAKVRPEKASER